MVAATNHRRKCCARHRYRRSVHAPGMCKRRHRRGRMVQLCPRGDTTCRSCSQMTQTPGGTMLSGCCGPQAVWMKRGVGAPGAATSVSSADEATINLSAENHNVA